MRFQDSANSSRISDGPHGINETATAPGQEVFTVPAIDVAKTFVFDARPLTPRVPSFGEAGEPLVMPPLPDADDQTGD
jgi:hypothetical protein